MALEGGHILLGDIGATNARLALLSDGGVGPIKYFNTADFPRFTDVVDAFFQNDQRCSPGQGAVLAVAGPIAEGRCRLTNCRWTIDSNELSARYGFELVHLCNDFEAVALSLPNLTAADLYPLGGGEPVEGAPMAVLGPGTGLGVAGLIPSTDGPVVIPSEGGHATMAATCAREDAILDHLRRQFDHVSAERVVSGFGLENLHRAIAAIDGREAPPRNAAEITEAALYGACPIAKAALELFCGMLGTIAGNVALMFGARGGVYIAGGIAPRMTEFLARSEFRARFESKGRVRNYLQAIPTRVIIHPAATFVGLQSIARRGPGAAVGHRRVRPDEP
jgi:glucokinase